MAGEICDPSLHKSVPISNYFEIFLIYLSVCKISLLSLGTLFNMVVVFYSVITGQGDIPEHYSETGTFAQRGPDGSCSRN